MAKTPRTAPAPVVSPWATPTPEAESAKADGIGNNGGGENTEATESDEDGDTSAPEAVAKAVESAPADETPSEVKDQVTPSGQNPSDAVEDALSQLDQDDDQETPAGVIVNTPDAVHSEDKDQVTPHGVDLSLAFDRAVNSEDSEEREFYEKLYELDEDERAEVEAKAKAYTFDLVKAAHRGRIARSMELNLVDSTQHYGTRAIAATEASKTAED